MEEILASIRRIIADDEAKPAPRAGEPPKAAAPPKPTPPPAPPPRPAASPPPAAASEIDALIASAGPQDTGAAPADILDLTESMATPPPSSGFRTVDAQPDVVFADPAPQEQGSDEAHDRPPPPRFHPGQSEQLLSGDAAAAVDAAFNSLAQTVLVHNARTLEDLVREMLRPMLKSWLDDNLPGLVERLVRSEIERVSRGRSG